MFKLDLEKVEEPEIKLPTSYDCWIIEKARELQKNICFYVIDYAKAFDCVNHNKLWKILERDGNTRPPYLQNLYADQDRTVRTRHGTTDLFQIRKGVCQGCILSTCLFNLYSDTSREMLG